MTPRHLTRPQLQCLRQQRPRILPQRRLLSITARCLDDAEAHTASQTDSLPPPSSLPVPPAEAEVKKIWDPDRVSSKFQELQLLKEGGKPVGSRRRRAAIKTSQNIPFELLPYQCFQEAQKVIAADREDKLVQIATERRRIAEVTARDAGSMGGERRKRDKLHAMKKHLEQLKILADINNPTVKKRHEDGLGDMNRPIYRYLADRDWRSYRRKIVMQRLTQMHVVSDLLPTIDPTVDVRLFYGRRVVSPGDFVHSALSAPCPPKITAQFFDRSRPRYVSIVILDGDVPDLRSDSFNARCHFLAVNIPISATSPRVVLEKAAASVDSNDQSEGGSIILPWIPPHAQKGSPYHRIVVFVLEQQGPERKDPALEVEESEAAPDEPQQSNLVGKLDVAATRERNSEDSRLGWSLRNFVKSNYLRVVGASMFRTVWDEGTAAVMRKYGLPGWDVELRRRKLEKLPYKKKDGERYR